MTLEEIQNLLMDALQSDLENGVHWMNNAAWTEWKKKMPELEKAISKIMLLSPKDVAWKDTIGKEQT